MLSDTESIGAYKTVGFSTILYCWPSSGVTDSATITLCDIEYYSRGVSDSRTPFPTLKNFAICLRANVLAD